MSSGLDTLLEAARYLELQEQQNVPPSPSPPSAGGRYHLQHFNNNNTNINSGNINNNNSSVNIRQVTSPPVSPIFVVNGNPSSNHSGINRHEYSEYGSMPAASTRNGEGRSEEPYINGHSVAPSYVVLPTSSKLQNDSPFSSDPSLLKSTKATEHIKDYTKNKSIYRLPSPNSSITNRTRYKFIPLTPPPMSSRKIEPTRVRSLSLSSNKFTANGNGTIVHNGNVHNVISATTEDSSQSSLNLSSSGYLSGSSANSSVGGCGSNLNLSNSTLSTSSIPNGDLQLPVQTQVTTGRRRTTSTNSNGGTQRSPCILRAGTREVHNKLEKHRRAHLKECFEQLKLQLQLKDEEKKKTSNLAILAAAHRHVVLLRRKEKDLEQQVEQLAKDKINAQKKILSLKRELSVKFDNIDLSNIISDGDIGNIPTERVSDSMSDILSLSSSGRSSVRYSSSSSLSSATTISSPGMQTIIPSAISPVISVPSNTSPSSPHLKSVSPITNSMPLSLTTKNLSASTLTRSSPTPSTPSPSPSSSGVSSSSPTSSSSPPIGNTSVALKIPHLPNGIKLSPNGSPSNIALVSPVSCTLPSAIVNITSTENGELLSHSPTVTTAVSMSLNSAHNMHFTSVPKDFTGRNGICRKTPDSRDSPGVILANTTSLNCAKEIKVDKIFDESEQPTKVIKLFNGIALAPVDKDNKLLSSTPLALSQVVGGGGLVVSPFPVLTTSAPGLRVIGTNGLATIELSTPTVQQTQVRSQHQSHTPCSVAVTSSSGAQLHKLLVSGASGNSSIGGNATISHATSELARLPGGAELNILPTGANGTTALYRGNGKLAIVNNSITLKGADASATSGRAVHVVTPLQSGGAPISGLTPIVVSQGQPGTNLAHIIATSPQLAGKVNLSVGGQALPLISTQYLSSMKPMVVAVASNTTPTLSSVPPTPTSATIATGTANGNSS